MGRVAVLGIYIAMIVGGALTLILQLVYSPAIELKFVIGSGAVALFGGYLLWEEFLR